MPSVTCTDIERNGNRVRIHFGKRAYDFASVEEVRSFVDNILTRDTLEALFMALAISRQAGLNNPNLLVGRTVNVNFAVNNWGTVS